MKIEIETVKAEDAMTALMLMEYMQIEKTTKYNEETKKHEECTLSAWFYGFGEQHGEGIWGMLDCTLNIHAPICNKLWEALDDDSIIFDDEFVSEYIKALRLWGLDYFETPPAQFIDLFHIHMCADHRWTEAACYWRSGMKDRVSA
jgi:hypothetical protein